MAGVVRARFPPRRYTNRHVPLLGRARLVGPVMLALVYALFGAAMLLGVIAVCVWALWSGIVLTGPVKPGHVLAGFGAAGTCGLLGVGLLLFARRLVIAGSTTQPIRLFSPRGFAAGLKEADSKCPVAANQTVGAAIQARHWPVVAFGRGETMRSTRAVCAGLALLAATGAGAAPLDISWDKDLAFDYDREHYQRELQSIVEQSYSLAAAETGLTLLRPLKVTVLTRARYEQQFGTGAAFTQGARYQRGAIYVNGGSRLNDAFSGVIVHEMTHAFLDHRGTAHRLPLWLNEGLAERLSWKRKGLDELAPNQKMEVQYAGRSGALIPLPAWGKVTFTYLQCYAAALFLEKKVGKDKMMAVVRRTLDGDSFERALDKETRWSTTDLEREFVSWVEHL